MSGNKISLILSTILALCLTACSGPSNTNNDNRTEKLSITIRWENFNGDTLEVDGNVPYGSMPTYDGYTPTRPNDNQYSYTFSGWTPEIVPAVEDATYIATYNKKLEEAKIYFDLDGGTTTHSTEPIYSSLKDSSQFFFDVTKENVNFRGWEYNGVKIFDQKGNKLADPELQEEMTFKAVYAQDVYLTIITNNPNGGVVSGEGAYPFNTNVEVLTII